MITEGCEDWLHLRFSAFHGAHERGVALPGLRQLAGTRTTEGLIRILRQFCFPFLEERLCNILDCRNALVDGLRSGFAPIQLGAELGVLCFERPAAKMDH